MTADTAADTTRRREHEWSDPAALAAAATELDGLEFLRRIAGGRLPGAPIGSLVGFRPVSAEPGRVVFEFEPAEHQYNPIGSVHGGVYATLLDSACGSARRGARRPARRRRTGPIPTSTATAGRGRTGRAPRWRLGCARACRGR